MAVAYDLVLEDHILAHQAAQAPRSGRSRARSPRWCATRSATSRARSSPSARRSRCSGYDPESRRDVMALAHLTRDTIGRLYKVLPTAVVAAAMRPSITRARARRSRRRDHRDACAAAGANLGVRSGRDAVEAGAEPLVDPQHHPRRARRPLPGPRAHRPALLRAHDPAPARRRAPVAPHPLMLEARLEGLLPRPRRQQDPEDASRRATACAARTASRGASSPAKRVEEAIEAARGDRSAPA